MNVGKSAVMRCSTSEGQNHLEGDWMERNVRKKGIQVLGFKGFGGY